MENWISKHEGQLRANLSQHLIDDLIYKGSIRTRDNLVSVEDIDAIIKQKEEYIGYRDFAAMLKYDKFDGKNRNSRNSLFSYMDANICWNVPSCLGRDLLFGRPDDKEVYFRREDVPCLKSHCVDFIRWYGHSDDEKYKDLVENSREEFPLATSMLDAFSAQWIKDKKPHHITETFLEMARGILQEKDYPPDTNQELVNIYSRVPSSKAREILDAFLNYAKDATRGTNAKIKLKRRAPQSTTAYSRAEIMKIATFLFDAHFIDSNKSFEKALSEAYFCEAWTFLAGHFVCAWRGRDIIDNWPYINLRDDNEFGIDVGTLYDDLLYDNISSDVYESVALYMTQKVTLMAKDASKTADTAKTKLRLEILPAFRPVFGKLMLIAEYHHRRYPEDGYMKRNLMAQYEHGIRLSKFFGYEFTKEFGNKNILSTRLNKSYIQGIERTARTNGATNIQAMVIAAFARNHNSTDSTLHYLQDHQEDGITASTVVYMMLQRGVMSTYLYHALKMAFPDSFELLPMEAQTRLMSRINTNAYALEVTAQESMVRMQLDKFFSNGDLAASRMVMQSMFNIAQGVGEGKDAGVYCCYKALGNPCAHPEYESCLASLCPYHVFTKDGIPQLVEVILRYKRLASRSDGIKYKAILQQILIPNFRKIIKETIEDMSPAEKSVMQGYIQRLIIESEGD